MKAVLSHYRQSPQKVRLVADLVRGKTVAAAERALAFLPQKSAPAVRKLLASAVANARSRGASPDFLVIKNIFVNKGVVIRRYKPMARGRASTIRRTRSVITLELAETRKH